MTYEFEKEALAEGYKCVCGIDEAGRGPLCGPVCAAAVILPVDCEIPGINDSKKLSEKKREALYDIIKEKMGKKTFLLDRLFEDIEILSNFFDTFIITDARLQEEFDAIKDKYEDVVAIKLERSNFEAELSEEEKNHITEKDLDNYTDFDYIIENSNLKDLKRVALEIVRNEENYGG